MTVGAFGWSAFGIYGFTVEMGIPAEMAWVAPLVIDLSVFGATRGLVLTAPPVAARMKQACNLYGLRKRCCRLRSMRMTVPTRRSSLRRHRELPQIEFQCPQGAPAVAARLDSPARNETGTGPAVTLSAEQSAPPNAPMPQKAPERALSAVPAAGRIPVQIRPESVPTTDDDSTTKKPCSC